MTTIRISGEINVANLSKFLPAKNNYFNLDKGKMNRVCRYRYKRCLSMYFLLIPVTYFMKNQLSKITLREKNSRKKNQKRFCKNLRVFFLINHVRTPSLCNLHSGHCQIYPLGWELFSKNPGMWGLFGEKSPEVGISHTQKSIFATTRNQIKGISFRGKKFAKFRTNSRN